MTTFLFVPLSDAEAKVVYDDPSAVGGLHNFGELASSELLKQYRIERLIRERRRELLKRARCSYDACRRACCRAIRLLEDINRLS